ncbi:MAG TPA: hypothetical protein VJN70_11840 [Gemmatimonadaceae bacterium]|nr:hypothetical protein [Gemmatimonadaceae bacterium]
MLSVTLTRASRVISRVAAPVAAMLIVLAVPRVTSAQLVWNDSTTRALVELATRLRAAQLADTGLTDYRAEAHGYLTFLAQVGQGFAEPPRIVKADELALEVYWRAPNLSKQRIVGRRDTLLLPTDIAYHRDHLGIVQNNFPNIIRLGEGDEVRDVPHPLSPAGLSLYDFAIKDSLRIELPGRRVNVYEVRVRPKDDQQARVVGAVYIDREEGQVVRMALSFTRAALLDKALEDVSIVLENRLVGTRFWLPSRQEIEIRRTGTWLDYPVRGIIRGRWEIGDYRINQGVPYNIFSGGGPEIVQAPPYEQQQHVWSTRHVLDSLPPDVRAVTDADVRRVQAEARALVRERALQRTRTLALSARGVSDFVRVNRVEGLALGGGLTQGIGGGLSVGGRARYGIDDETVKWQARLEWQNGSGISIRAFGLRDFHELGEEPERSRALNSIASQEFGSDYTDPFRVEGGGLSFQHAPVGEPSWTIEAALERPSTLAVHDVPVTGTFVGLVGVPSSRYARLAVRRERPTSLWVWGTELRTLVEVRGLRANGDSTTPCAVIAVCPLAYTTLRASVVAGLERPFGNQRLVMHTIAGGVGGKDDVIPSQELFYFGGPVSAPGYDFHQLVGRMGLSERLEWHSPIPFFPVPLGRFGKIPASATLAPYAQFVGIAGSRVTVQRDGQLLTTVPGGYVAVGAGLLTFFDLVRFDVSRGLRNGRWLFAFDVNPDFWSIL